MTLNVEKLLCRFGCFICSGLQFFLAVSIVFGIFKTIEHNNHLVHEKNLTFFIGFSIFVWVAGHFLLSRIIRYLKKRGKREAGLVPPFEVVSSPMPKPVTTKS